MRKLILILTATMMALAASAQHYSIHSATKGVKVETSGKTSDATKGMVLKASDCLVIPDGGTVEILNGLDKRIYKSVRPGKVTVTKLMIEAREVASDNSGSVGNTLRFGKKEGSSDRRVYVEKGMVNRSLAVYDPEGDKVEMNPSVLARYIAVLLGKSPEALPEGVTRTRLENGGIGFKVENTREYPLYFNILRIYGDTPGKVEISPLGQPGGFYVVLPDQTLAREHKAILPDGDLHLMVMTPAQFDLDLLVEELGHVLRSGLPADWDGDPLPVSVVGL